ncbi:MAG: hypothetical protein IJ806_03215 [Ruminococcus sp.]|nr:hypothetical protein [Ruminococcus sp.]
MKRSAGRLCAFAAGLGVCALLLGGCGAKKTDLPDEYKDFLDYTLGGGYTVSEGEGIDDGVSSIVSRRWNVGYTDRKGDAREGKIELIYERGKEEEVTEEEKKAAIANFVNFEIGENAGEEFYEVLMKKYFPDAQKRGSYFYENSEVQICIQVFNTDEDLDSRQEELRDRWLDTENGLSVREQDLKSCLEQENYLLMVDVTPADPGDNKRCIELLHALEEDVTAFCGSAQNFQLRLSGNSGVVYNHAYLLGDSTLDYLSIEYVNKCRQKNGTL